MKELEEYNGSETVETALGDKIAVGLKLKAPYGVKLRPFVEKYRSFVHWMRNQGQASLDFESTAVLADAKIKVDKPVKSRKDMMITVVFPCGGTNGFELQSTLFNLAQTKTPVDVKIVTRPKPPAKTTKPAPQPGEEGADKQATAKTSKK